MKMIPIVMWYCVLMNSNFVDIDAFSANFLKLYIECLKSR